MELCSMWITAAFICSFIRCVLSEQGGILRSVEAFLFCTPFGTVEYAASISHSTSFKKCKYRRIVRKLHLQEANIRGGATLLNVMATCCQFHQVGLCEVNMASSDVSELFFLLFYDMIMTQVSNLDCVIKHCRLINVNVINDTCLFLCLCLKKKNSHCSQVFNSLSVNIPRKDTCI